MGSTAGSKRQQRIPARERLVLKLPGGGGYRNPLERDPELVRRDVEDGLVSPEHALEAYRVVLSGGEDGFVVDEKAAARRRAEAGGARP